MIFQRIKALITIVIIYSFACIGSIFLYDVLPFDDSLVKNILIKFFIIDIICTIFIFILSCIFNNSSLYDPYWSVAPVVMVIAFIKIVDNVNFFSVFLVSLISLWGLRLTVNFLIGFRNLRHQDWRYLMFKEKYPKIFPLLNLLGIHLMPTIIVFIALIPALNFIGDVTKPGFEPTLMTIVAYAVIFIAIIIETIADLQLYLFKRYPSNHGLVLSKGLWKNSRHPNYFGECLFWFGIFLIHFSFKDANPLLVVSPLVMFILFEFISIPMMDKRQLNNKASYKEYYDSTNAMLPIFPPKKKN